MELKTQDAFLDTRKPVFTQIAHAGNRTEIIHKWRTPAGKSDERVNVVIIKREMMTHCVETSGGEEENQQEEKPVLTPILLY